MDISLIIARFAPLFRMCNNISLVICFKSKNNDMKSLLSVLRLEKQKSLKQLVTFVSLCM